MNKEQFEKAGGRLACIYSNIFFEKFKDMALKIGLDESQWAELCNNPFGVWDKYTNFFDNLTEELDRRIENKYYYVDDLLNPNTSNLDFQITEKTIKESFIRNMILDSFAFDDFVNYLISLNLFDFIEKYENNDVGEFLKTFYPLSIYESKIPFSYPNQDLLNIYNGCFFEPKYPSMSMEVSMAFEFYSQDLKYNCNSLFEKGNMERILGYLRDISDVFYKYSSNFLTNTLVDVSNPDSVSGWDFVEKFELNILKLFFSHSDEIINDEKLSRFYCGYLIEKIKLLKGGHISQINSDGVVGGMDGYYDSLAVDKIYWDGIYRGYSNHFKDNYVTKAQLMPYYVCLSKEKIDILISYFKNNGNLYELLKIYYMLYCDILKRDETEAFVKELLFRLKKISEDTDKVVIGLKEYLMYLLSNVFNDANGGKKPEYFSSISEDIKEIFGDNDYKRFEKLFSDDSLCQGEEIVRKNYKIGLVFGDKKSKKAFDLYSNDKRNEHDFIDRQLDRKQFKVLAEEFYDQQNLNIAEKLDKGMLSFVLCFETDHETKLRNLMKSYPDRIIVCNIPGQHFSHTQFRKMLDLGLSNIENKSLGF